MLQMAAGTRPHGSPRTLWVSRFPSPDTGEGIVTSGEFLGSSEVFKKIGPLCFSSSLFSKNNQGPRNGEEWQRQPGSLGSS